MDIYVQIDGKRAGPKGKGQCLEVPCVCIHYIYIYYIYICIYFYIHVYISSAPPGLRTHTILQKDHSALCTFSALQQQDVSILAVSPGPQRDPVRALRKPVDGCGFNEPVAV